MADAARFSNLRREAQHALTRSLTSVLRRMGLRDTIVRRRLARKRRQRTRAEARGEDRYSRPALHELERKLDAVIDRDGGFFVEAGGHDGYTQSNTYWLERFRGWRGMLVEPMPELAAEARLSRPEARVFECALVAPEQDGGTVTMHFGDLMSMVAGAKEEDWPSLGTTLGWRDAKTLQVPARTLSSLLDEMGAPEVDLLSLDVEGFEAQALRGVDLTRHAPRYIVIEVHDAVRDLPPVEEVLAGSYVQHSWLSPVDLLFVRSDLAGERADHAD